MTDSVFTIVDEMERLDALLEESGGELTEEIEQALDQVEGQFYDKAEKIGAYILALVAHEATAKAEAQRLRDLTKVRTNKVTRLKTYLKFMLESTGRDKVETATFRIGLCQNSQPTIRWQGPSAEIPETFRITDYRVDGAKAQAYLKEHSKLPDGFDVELGSHVRIK